MSVDDYRRRREEPSMSVHMSELYVVDPEYGECSGITIHLETKGRITR